MHVDLQPTTASPEGTANSQLAAVACPKIVIAIDRGIPIVGGDNVVFPLRITNIGSTA